MPATNSKIRRPAHAWAACLCLFVITAVSCIAGAAEPSAGAASEIELRENLEYGKGGGQPLTLHLARPKDLGTPAPGLLFIHGGGWAKGDKDQLKELIRDAAKRGYVSVSVGYRLAPDHPFPAQVEDVKCAVRWMRARADRLHVDPNRLGAIGFSAGAHLSMMLGAMDTGDGLEGDGGWPDQSSKVQAVVSYFGPTDLMLEYPPASRDIVKTFIGGTKQEMADSYRKASPINYVNAGDAPMLLFQGTADVLVPYEQGFVMAGALAKAKVPGRVELILGANHGWLGPELERTQSATYAFFDEWLKQ